jgi:N-acetyl-anhydromuramyl-L-alanine amidase AmpD
MNLQRLPHPLSTAPRKDNVQPTLLILHATAGASAMSSIDYLRTKGNAYHFIIARDAKDSPWTYQSDGSESVIYQCARYQHRARHVSTTIPVPGTKDGNINDYSVAVSLANFQQKVKADPYNGPEEYTDQQMLALNGLLTLIKRDVPTITHLTTHAVVQPWNRADPVRIDGKALAERFGWEWWKPSPAVVAKYKPKKSTLV